MYSVFPSTRRNEEAEFKFFIAVILCFSFMHLSIILRNRCLFCMVSLFLIKISLSLHLKKIVKENLFCCQVKVRQSDVETHL